MRRASSAAIRLLSRPTVMGALYLLLLSAMAAAHPMSGERELGNRAEGITDLIHRRFDGEILRVAEGIGAAAVAIGVSIGLAVALVQAARTRLAGRPLHGTEKMLHSLAGVAFVHGIFEWRSMALSPQLYDAEWYAKGGAPRLAQVLATDLLHASGITAVGVGVLLVYVAGPPRSLREARDLFDEVASSIASIPSRVYATAVAAITVVALLAALPHTATALAHPPLLNSNAPPNVIILAADSLRNDHVRDDLTPNITALAKRGVRYDSAYVSLPRTFPSWVTFLTGRHPHHHGIRSMFPRWEDRTKDFDALPGRLAAAGYATAVVSDYAGDIFSHIDLGFRDVRTPTFDFRQLIRQRALEMETPLLPTLHSRLGRVAFPVLRELNTAADPHMLASDANDEIDRIADRPFMMTVFFSTAHFPYASPAPFYASRTDPAYRGHYKYFKPVGLGRDVEATAEDVSQVRALYAGAVASVDDALGEIVSHLERTGLAKRTIIVVTADHGETLFDNGRGQGHGDHLFGDEATHVPLIIVDPRVEGGAHVRAISRDVDLAPTLYAATGVAPPDDLDGVTLGGASSGVARMAFAETGLWFTPDIDALAPDQRLQYPDVAGLTELDSAHGYEIVIRKEMVPLTVVAKHRMARDARWKIVYMPTRRGPSYMLFDTETDPSERVNVAATHADEFARMKDELWRFMRQDRAMCERGGLLVPCVAAEVAAPESGAIRLDNAPGAHAKVGP